MCYFFFIFGHIIPLLLLCLLVSTFPVEHHTAAVRPNFACCNKSFRRGNVTPLSGLSIATKLRELFDTCIRVYPPHSLMMGKAFSGLSYHETILDLGLCHGCL